MTVGLLRFDIRLPEAQSLKEKRGLVKSLVTRIRNRFNVSISEVENQDKWQLATVAVAHVGGDSSHTNQLLDQVLDFAEAVKQVEVIHSQIEIL